MTSVALKHTDSDLLNQGTSLNTCVYIHTLYQHIKSILNMTTKYMFLTFKELYKMQVFKLKSKTKQNKNLCKMLGG